MVQAFTKLQRVDQRAAGPVIAVKSLQVGACNQECGDPPAVGADPDFGQVPAKKQGCFLLSRAASGVFLGAA